ncbi:MAG: terpene cyclase/mutase family protein [Phycisphaerales bacterium]|nr:terpene cyclase/mutase family protein [Phycisphaerales bacterium]
MKRVGWRIRIAGGRALMVMAGLTALAASVLPRALGQEAPAQQAPTPQSPAQPPPTPPQPASGQKVPAALQPGALPRHITPQAKQAIDKGLAYLTRIQNRDGSWANRAGSEGFPVAMTALCGVALLMDGNTTTQGRYAENVDRAARYILASQTATGLIARETLESRPMYGHGFSMLFLGELSGMVESPRRQQEIQAVLNRAVVLTARSQSPLGGWIYTPDSRGDEGSVTITQVQGLRSCRNGGVEVPKDLIDEAMRYLDRSQNPDGGMQYTASRPGPSRIAITAAAAACWLNAGMFDEPRLKRAMDFCKRTIGPEGVVAEHFFYTNLYWSQSVYLSNDKLWDEYFPKVRDRLVSMQNGEEGSWPGEGIGEVYGTTTALIILQLPYNRLPIMQR